MKAKRDQLKTLSKAAAQLVETEEAASINDALILIYAQQGHTEIHSMGRTSQSFEAGKRKRRREGRV